MPEDPIVRFCEHCNTDTWHVDGVCEWVEDHPGTLRCATAVYVPPGAIVDALST
jgi:hypothetical protein